MMQTQFESIEAQALGLPLDERTRLVQRLLLSLEDSSEDEISALWIQEALKRMQAANRGEIEVISGDVVMQEARALVK